MACVPEHQAQLGRGVPVPGRTQGSRDCGPRTVQMGIDHLTCGEVVPTIRAIRRRMGAPGPQPTSIDEAKRAVESYSRVPGRRPLRYYKKGATQPVKDAVAAGKFVQIAIDYRTFNDLMARTGDPNFRGGHSVGVFGERRKGGKVQWLLWDPLDDERRPEIPAGPRWVPRWKVVRAMEAFAGGEGLAQAGVFGGGQRR